MPPHGCSRLIYKLRDGGPRRDVEEAVLRLADGAVRGDPTARQTYSQTTPGEARSRRAELLALASELWPWALAFVTLGWAVLGFISQ